MPRLAVSPTSVGSIVCVFWLPSIVFAALFIPCDASAIPPGSKYTVVGFGGGSSGEVGDAIPLFFRLQTRGGAPLSPVFSVNTFPATDTKAFRDRFLGAAPGGGEVTFIPGENECRYGLPTVIYYYSWDLPSIQLASSNDAGGPWQGFTGKAWPPGAGRSAGTSQVIPSTCFSLTGPDADSLANVEDGPIDDDVAVQILEAGTFPVLVPALSSRGHAVLVVMLPGCVTFWAARAFRSEAEAS